MTKKFPMYIFLKIIRVVSFLNMITEVHTLVNFAATRLRTFKIFYLKIDNSFAHDEISCLPENK
jgi:hypothetical protein